ncbi:MAG: hypothetical protein ABR956_00130 [Terracidiphilus sp.]
MKRALIVFAILLILPALARAAKPTPNPADYTIIIHVQSSQAVKLSICSGSPKVGECQWVQHLAVKIDGKKYELEEGARRTDLLRVGDYKAKIVVDETTLSYEYQRVYEILFPDGKTRQYTVVGESE